MITYKLQINQLTQQAVSVLRSDGWSIPFASDNTDYQEYLAWLAEGGVPEPADSQE
jgi:hypothetical protein